MKTVASGRAGLLQRPILVILSILPCAIAFGWSAWPWYAIWVALGGVRLRYRDSKVSQDCLLFGLLNVIVLRERTFEATKKLCDIFLKDGALVAVTSALAVVVLVAFVYASGRNDDSRKVHQGNLPAGTHPWTLEHPRPFIIPSRTTHARIFPKKHAFGYNYLLCGFPIVPIGTTSDGTDVFDGSDKLLGRWWLRVRAEDYLTRGQASLGFYGKLKAFLREKGVKDSEWSYAYLVTAPRFFGYSFNPASFWYIYGRHHELVRMIIEVNNTFGERRMYLLDGSSPPTPDEEVAPSEPTKTTFADYWTKDFHVSPFNSRKGGGYKLKARNPFNSPTSLPHIDATITMKSTKDHPKLVARLFSVGDASDMEHLNWFENLVFVVTRGWIGFLTFPRILKEAFVLYFRRGLHVWFRPEVLAPSIGRLPSQTECFLQEVFRDYLFHLVHLSADPICIDYETAIPDKAKDIVKNTDQRNEESDIKALDIRVSTGAFYSRFVHYAHTSEAFDQECLFTDEKNRTLWISQPDVLPLLIAKTTVKTLEKEEGFVKRSYLEELRWTVLRKLRCPPAAPAYPSSPKSADFEIDDIRTLPFSELDHFVRGPTGQPSAGLYRRAVTKLFLAQRYALGFTEVIDFLDLCLRAMFCWLGASVLASFGQSGEQFYGLGLHDSWWTVSISVCVCHLYGILKGYT